MPLALLFDLDGTLMDTLDVIVLAMNAACDEIGVSPPFRSAELRPMIGTPVQRQLRDLRGVTGPRAEVFTDAYYTHFSRSVDDGIQLYPGVSETFPILAGRAMTTMSTRRRTQAERMLRVAGLRSYFQDVVGGDQAARPKPNPDLPFLGAKLLRVPPDRCAVIGDSPVDILAGRAAGMKAVGVLYGYGDGTAIGEARPDASIQRFADLPKALEALEP